MKNVNWKELFIDILVDIVAGMIIAVGIYNFALNADFPVAGFSGIAIILYHIFGLPVGAGTIILNVPVAIFCYKFLGKGSSTGGQDFISVAIKKVKPHITLGIITFVLDICTIILGTVLVFKDVDGLIYGVIVTYLMAMVMDRIMYGIDEGKMTLIVTDKGAEIAEQIDAYSGRGSTILKGMGSYSKKNKDVVMCACNNKQMYTIKKMVHTIDPKAFTIIVESNEVVGEGFKEEIPDIEL